VLRKVNGQLAAVDSPILVHDLSRTGFAVISRIAFYPGQTLDFRLVADDGSSVNVTAEAVHTRPAPSGGDLHLSGFAFVQGRLTGIVPQALIDRLIEAVTPYVPAF
jgi:PilZ domain-containing protein